MTSDDKRRPRTGFFDKLKTRLNRGRSWLTEDLLGLSRTFDESTLEELETRLLTADVGVEATEWILERMRKRRGSRDESALDALRGAITELLAPLETPLDVASTSGPFVILAVGVNGTGKTTTLGKLAHRLRREGRSVLLAAGDTFRAAAVEQLAEWSRRADAELVSQATGADPAAVAHDAVQAAKARASDVVLVDTAGRLHTSAGLMDELDKIKRVIGRALPGAPHEVLLVLDASQGQNALQQAVKFHERLGVTGLILTKLDGTAKGGIVLAIARRLGTPIRFITVGEGIEDFDVFSAAQFASVLVGDPAA